MISNLEIGVNIPHHNPQRVLDSLMVHRNTPFYTPIVNYHKQCEKTELFIKCYSKSDQFELQSGVLRFELKLIRSRVIYNFLKIKTLDDVMQVDWVKDSTKMLLDYWDEILVIDRAMQDEIISIGKAQWFDQVYWNSLTRMQRRREKKRYESDIESSLNMDIRKLIERECYKLRLQV